MMKFRRLKKVLLPVLIMGVLIAVGYGSLIFFKIRTLDIRGTSTIEGAGNLKNQNLLFISTEKVEEELYRANAHVQTVTVTKVFPSVLQISVKEARDKAYIKVDKGFIVINSAYRISAKTVQGKVPPRLMQIEYHQPLSLQSLAIGDSVPSSDIEVAVFFTDALTKIGLHVSGVDIVNFYMILLHSDDGDITVTSEKSRQQQYEVLKEAITQLKISGKKIQSIDVRFDKPIIRLLE